ncbi:uncharacterized protein LOC132554870 [Ylistrum balloti]|uniref:uncharacterized protein LOC132554870 n=1 Tax=Ylistrum balloti TaxID=509963 RepID=UPI002905B4A8|nr:uncharacterized protein LOC132554870 [Ylistrum balloti]
MGVQWLFHVWLTVTGFLIYGVESQPSPQESLRQCAPWTRLSKGINQYQGRQGKGVNIACKDHSHDKCEQLDCGGRYILDFVSIEFNVCLGLIFHHCNNPPAMEFSLQLPTLNSSIHQMVVHNDSIPVPGLSKKVGNNTAEVELYVELRRKNATSFAFRISGRVRLTSTLFGRVITDWPENLQRDIITIDDLPVTRCTTTTNSTLSPLKVCNVDEFIGTSVSTAKPVSTTTTPIKITSATYNKSCEFGSLGKPQCSQGEACFSSRCLCAYDYQLSSHGICQFVGKKTIGPILKIPLDTSNPTKPAIPQPASQHQPTSTPGMNKTAMIIGGSVGGLVLVAAIIIAVVVIIRKRGARYQGRELLLTEEDTDVAI